MRNQATKRLSVGGVLLGGGESVKIQSMTTTKTSDIEGTVKQITVLENAGCEIIRVAVADEADALAIKQVKEKIKIPLVADIHFSPKLAVMAMENGADKIRINPGNIGGEKEIEYVADCIKAHKIPVRVGSNTGSIEKNFLEKSGKKEKGTEGRRNQSKEKEFIFLHTNSLIQKQFIKIVILSFSFCSAYQILKQL